MAPDKLPAEWFWIDRWMGSSAFGLPIDARGLYREMLTQAWLRGAQLPNDHDQIRRFVGVTKAEWRHAWPFVERFWRVDGENLINDTQVEIYAESKGRSTRASNRGLKGAQAMHKQRLAAAQAPAQAALEQQPPISDLGTTPVSPLRTDLEPPESMKWFDRVYGAYPNKDRKQDANAAWIELGPDLQTAQAIHADIVARVQHGWKQFERRFIPQLGRFLRERMWEDAKDGAAAITDEDPYAKFTMAWQCPKCGEIHEGARADKGKCLKKAS